MKPLIQKLKEIFRRLLAETADVFKGCPKRKDRNQTMDTAGNDPEDIMSETEEKDMMLTENEAIPAEAVEAEEIEADAEDKKKKKKKVNLFLNREFSWIDFNERVLEEAENLENPLLERANFLSIYQTNLDEFFEVRIGKLLNREQVAPDMKDGRSKLKPDEQIEEAAKKLKKLEKRNRKTYEELTGDLNHCGIRLINFSMLSENEADELEAYFRRDVMPMLTPYTVGKKDIFPFMNSEDLYAFCVLKDKAKSGTVGVVPCTIKSLPRLIRIAGRSGEYMLLEELVLHFMSLLFRQYSIGEKAVIRITRSADIDAQQMGIENLSYREQMEQVIVFRKRLFPVWLEYSREMKKSTVEALSRRLGLSKKLTFLREIPLDLSFFSNFRDELSDRPELSYEKRQPQKSSMIDENRSVIDQVREKDVLLYYPYERMNPMIQLLTEASKDPYVTSIRMTLYRVAKNSQIVEALVNAAENGKQVDVLIELKARFDEEANITWSRRLEEGGCHVMMGLGSYKVHSKLLLITRKQGDETEYFTQIGTGNYNEKTARIYTDLCFMTAKKEIGLEAEKVFAALAAGELPEDFEHLLVSPHWLKPQVIAMIEREIGYAKAGEDAYIGLKMNSLSDKAIMKKLIEASEAGVRIEMVIRGVNCLKTGVEGKTDNIRAVSIVGRYLEHARVYIFGTEKREKIYISSADFMTRNTMKRVEVAAPIEDADLRRKIHRIFALQLLDNVQLREMNPDGEYHKLETEEHEMRINSQEYFLKKAYEGEV